MKSRILLFLIIIFFPFLSLHAREWYVSVNGSDQNPGTIQKPCRTIQFVLNRIQPGDQCYIRQGVYRENLEFKRSGTKKNPIVIKSYKNEKVQFQPLALKGKWQRWKGKIYRIPVKDSVIQLFAKNVSQMQASYPSIEEGKLNTSGWMKLKLSPSKTIDFPGDLLLKNLKGSYLLALCGHGLVAVNGQITQQKVTQLTIDSDAFYWGEKFTSRYLGNGYGFFTGKLCFLDAPGEWFYESGYLYYYPKRGHPQKDNINVRTRLFTLSLKGSKYIVVKNIRITGGTILLENAENCIVDGVKIQYPTPFFKCRNGFDRSNYDIEKRSRLFEGVGLYVSGKNNKVVNSEIRDSWGDGITVTGSNNRIEKCKIENCDWMGVDCAPVVIEGFKNSIEYSELSKSGRSIVLHSGLRKGRIRFNKVFDAGFLCDDLGVIYAYMSDGEGTEISYNWVHDSHAPHLGVGIYLDNGHRNYKVHHNVVWNCFVGMMINQPCSNDRIYNNTFWKNKYTMSTFHPQGIGVREMREVYCYNNLTDSKLESIFHRPFEGSNKKGNLIVEDLYNVLKNPKDRDFKPHANSEVRNKGVELKQHKFVASNDCVGAYCKEDWVPGVPEEQEREYLLFKWFLFGGYSFLFFVIVRYFNLFSEFSFKGVKLLFGIKLVFGFFLFFVYTFHYPNREHAEIFKHFDDAKLLYNNLFSQSPKHYFQFILGYYEPKDLLLQLEQWNTGGFLEINHFLIRLHAVLNLFSGAFYPIHVLFFAIASFFASYRLFQFYSVLFPVKKMYLIVGVFCVPSLLFWTSGTLEDTLLLSLVCSGLYRGMRTMTAKNKVFHVVLLVLSLIGIFVIRPYIIVAVLPLFILLFFYLLTKRLNGYTIALSSVLVFGIILFSPRHYLRDQLVYVQQDLLAVSDEMHAHSRLSVEKLDVQQMSFIKAIPRAVWNVFVEPIPRKDFSFVKWIQFLENCLVAGLLFLGFWGIRKLDSLQRYLLFMGIAVSFFILLFIGWTIPIAGLIVRYKVFMYPFLLPFFFSVVSLLSAFKKEA